MLLTFFAFYSVIHTLRLKKPILNKKDTVITKVVHYQLYPSFYTLTSRNKLQT